MEQHRNFIVGDSVESILQRCPPATDFCVIVAAGAYFNTKENWTRHLDKDISIMGHIMEKGIYPSLHCQTIIVNMHKWNFAGRPSFGYPTRQSQIVRTYDRSPENVHDDYTPLWLNILDETSIRPYFDTGWNLISEMGRYGKIVNIPEPLRNSKQYLYPRIETQHILLDVLNGIPSSTADDEEDKHLKRARNLTLLSNDAVYPVNTDDVLTIGKKLERHNVDQADVILCPAAGFLSFFSWRHFVNLHPSKATKISIVHYDVSSSALEFMRFVNEKWDGTNYPEFVNRERQRSEFENAKFYALDRLDSEWRKIYSSFEPENNFKKEWKKYVALKHSYIKCDITTQVELLTEFCKATTVIHISNIFIYLPLVYGRSTSQIQQSFSELSRVLSSKCDQLHIIGAPPRSFQETDL